MPKAKMLRLGEMFGPILLRIADIIYEPSITAHGATTAATITTSTKIQVTSTQPQWSARQGQLYLVTPRVSFDH